jgi:hypothetical protein
LDTLGFSSTLDNPKAAKWYPTFAATSGQSGNGLTNNRIFSHSSDNQTSLGVHNATIGNAAAQYKVARYVDATNIAGTNIIGTNGLLTAAQLSQEYRPCFTTSGNYMIWYDYAVIKLNHLFESLNEIGLVRKLDASICLWVNTGTVNIAVGQPNSTDLNYRLVPGNNTFSSTCPLMVNYHEGSAGTGMTTDPSCNQIVAGLYKM